jgi:hypothetical protein
MQIHTLLKGLEKIVVSADTPMLVCVYFNSIPGRLWFMQVHTLCKGLEKRVVSAYTPM